jgi:hypothetical protein
MNSEIPTEWLKQRLIEIVALERSWADCARGLTTGHPRHAPRPNGTYVMSALSLDAAATELTAFHVEYESGYQPAALWALRLCLEHNLPVPWWASEAIQARLQRLTDAEADPVSLHNLFGLDALLPTTGVRAKSKRRDWVWAIKIYMSAQEKLSGKKRMTKEKAIAIAAEEISLPFERTTALRLYEMAEKAQRKKKRKT